MQAPTITPIMNYGYYAPVSKQNIKLHHKKEKCSICFEHLRGSGAVYACKTKGVDTINHLFHQVCIEPWVERHPRCGCCAQLMKRTSLLSKDKMAEIILDDIRNLIENQGDRKDVEFVLIEILKKHYSLGKMPTDKEVSDTYKMINELVTNSQRSERQFIDKDKFVAPIVAGATSLIIGLNSLKTHEGIFAAILVMSAVASTGLIVNNFNLGSVVNKSFEMILTLLMVMPFLLTPVYLNSERFILPPSAGLVGGAIVKVFEIVYLQYIEQDVLANAD